MDTAPKTGIATRALSVILGAAFILLPAFFNGFPIVNSDDGTYLHSGFMPEMPGDRPIAYGILLNVFSLNGVSLWIAIAVQAMAMAWLILHASERVLGARYSAAKGVFIVALLSLTTSLSWIGSEAIPDVCTPMALLAAWLLMNSEEPRWTRVLLYTIYALAVATHISHVMIFGLLIGGFFLFKKWLVPVHARTKIFRTVVTLGVLTTLMLATMLKPIGHSRHVFTMAALLDQGILKPYLDEACASKPYKLCQYKDNLNPDPNHFLWEAESPVYKEGGWKAVRDEYSQIISDIHAQPKYLWARLKASARNTGRQTLSFGIGDGNVPFGEGSHVHSAVKKYLPTDERAYLAAWQHNNDRKVEDVLAAPNTIIYAVVAISLLALIGMTVLRRAHMAPVLRFFLLFALFGIAINIWNCATFAQVNGRYGCRVMWLIPLCALLCAFALRSKDKKAPAIRPELE